MPNNSAKTTKATDIIRQYMFGSLATKMMPSLPILDDVVECEVRLRLVQALAKNYDISDQSQRLRCLLGELVGIRPSAMAVKLINNAITPGGHGEQIREEAKAFLGESFKDGAEELAGRFIKTIVPGARLVMDFGEIVEAPATLYAVGRVFMKHFEAGGTILNFNASLFKEEFEKEILIGHNIVEIWTMKGQG
jgi:hypothetical protein